MNFDTKKLKIQKEAAFASRLRNVVLYIVQIFWSNCKGVHPKLYCTAEVCTQNCFVQQRCPPKQLLVNGVLFLEIVKVLNIFKSSAIKCVYIVADTIRSYKKKAGDLIL